MTASRNGKILTAIDIGTTKICVLTALVENASSMSLLGIGKYPSEGLKRGIIVDLNAAAKSIQQAVASAEQESGIRISEAVVGLSGAHIQSFNARGVVPIKYNDVDEHDIERVLDAAKNIPLPEGREILHVIPQFFKIDGQEPVQESLGMRGSRLEAQVHIVTGAVWSAENIIKACRLAGIRVTDIVLEQIASAAAVLSPSEQELGTAVLDIGGGTSDFAIYKNGRVIHSMVVPVAGNQFTNDLALCLGIPIPAAEQLKRTHGTVTLTQSATPPTSINLTMPTGGNKVINAGEIADILNPRATELFELVLDEILKFKLAPLMRAGLVLTGGGALLKDLDLLAVDLFHTPIRIGTPLSTASCAIPELLANPIYATGYGLLLHATKEANQKLSEHNTKLFSKLFKKMKNWIYDFL